MSETASFPTIAFSALVSVANIIVGSSLSVFTIPPPSSPSSTATATSSAVARFLLRSTTVLATSGFVFEALFSVKFLLSGAENPFNTAFLNNIVSTENITEKLLGQRVIYITLQLKVLSVKLLGSPSLGSWLPFSWTISSALSPEVAIPLSD